MTRVLIVGGGITGLSTAFYLQLKAPELKITLMEQSDRLGGKIRTERADRFIMELGPDSVLQLARGHPRNGVILLPITMWCFAVTSDMPKTNGY